MNIQNDNSDQAAGHFHGAGCGCGCGGHGSKSQNKKFIKVIKEILRARPEGIDPARLATSVLGIKNSPPELAGRLIDGLLEADPQFEKSGGLWKLTETAFTIIDNVPFVIADVETTGGRAATCRVIELGAFRVLGGAVTGSMMSLINPRRPIPVPISMLTGIRDEHVRDAPDCAFVMRKFLSFIEGAVFVGHNANFDFGFLNAELSRAGLPALGNDVVCTIKLTRRIFPGLPSYSLDSLMRYFDLTLDPSERHRGHGDAWATAEILLRCFDRLRRAGVESLEDLLKFQSMPPKKARKVWKMD